MSSSAVSQCTDGLDRFSKWRIKAGLLFLYDGRIPRLQYYLPAFGDGCLKKQIHAGMIRTSPFLWIVRVVQVVVQRLVRAIRIVFDANRHRQLLVRTRQASLLNNIQKYALLQLVAECGSFVRQAAFTERIAGNGWIFGEKRVIVVGERFRGV